jgi:hypothetical protein
MQPKGEEWLSIFVGKAVANRENLLKLPRAGFFRQIRCRAEFSDTLPEGDRSAPDQVAFFLVQPEDLFDPSRKGAPNEIAQFQGNRRFSRCSEHGSILGSYDLNGAAQCFIDNVSPV